LEEYVSDLSILFAVDWVLGMLRTSVNIWGDACACVIVDTWEKRRLSKQADDGGESESLIS
jgi:Na+/H+-dicarboxylate symporter